MTQENFKDLKRGDIVRVDGSGLSVIEAAYFQHDIFKVDIRSFSGCETKGIPDYFSFAFEPCCLRKHAEMEVVSSVAPSLI